MIIADVQQNTPEWYKIKTGIPSASNFDKLMTTKGGVSKQRRKYMYQLVAERITGVKEDTYQNSIMQRGIDMEDEARSMYEFITGNTVKQVGFCYPNDKKRCGCSPDGLVGKDGLLEVKSPTSAVHVGYIIAGVLPIDYMQQCQGQLFVTGRKWVDFFSFYPGLKSFIIRVKPDSKFLNILQIELEVFVNELNDLTERLREAT